MSAFEDYSGKINSPVFKEIVLPNCGLPRDEILTGPEFGVDTSVIDLGNGLGMAVSSDPLSLIPSLGLKESAWLSVHLLVNDMATTGFSPMYAQFVLNLPPDLNIEAFKEYWKYISKFCEETGVSVTGGHTGQAEGQNSTISGGGTMFLTAPVSEIITSNRAEPDDSIVVTKEAALTATSILAMSFPETVKQRTGKEVYEKGCENFYRTSSLKEALAAAKILRNNVELKAMHDVTEGGVLGAIFEMADASGCGFTVYNDKLPVGEVQRQISKVFEIDPRFCVGAGSMVMAVKREKESDLINHLKSESIPATVVGRMTAETKGFRIIEDDKEKNFSFNGKDPYWGAFFKAIKEGWG